MKSPFWFNIINQWKQMGKGEYGVTFPFLVGAILETSHEVLSKKFVRGVFQEIVHNQISGFCCEVRWCLDIDEPVVSMKKLSEPSKVFIGSEFKSKNTDEVSLAFTTDLMGMTNLACTTNMECLEKLINLTLQKSEQGLFSKNSGNFTPFTTGDIEFIKEVHARYST